MAQTYANVGCANIFGTPANNILSKVTINGVGNTSASTASNEYFPGVNISPVNAGANLTIAAEGALDSYNNIAVFAYLDFNNDGYYNYFSGSVEMKKLYSLASYDGNYSTGNQTFNIPSNTASGTYTLRIIAFTQASATTLNPCNAVSMELKAKQKIIKLQL